MLKLTKYYLEIIFNYFKFHLIPEIHFKYIYQFIRILTKNIIIIWLINFLNNQFLYL